MAILYVRSTDGNDADSGATWALAKATLAGAFTAAAAGDTIYVSDNHAETQASNMTLTSPGTAASPCRVICVDDAAEPPTALATTGTITVTGNFTITISGFVFFYGLTFSGSSGAVAAAGISISTSLTPSYIKFHTCAVRRLAANSNDVTIGSTLNNSDDQEVVFENTTFQVGHVNDSIIPKCRFRWINTPSAITGATISTALFSCASASGGTLVECYGVDFSAMGSGKSLVDIAPASNPVYRFRNCKLGSSSSITTGSTPGQGGAVVEVVNCDSAGTNYRYWYQDYSGTIEHETTIVRTGGASDGTTPVSREMVSSANAKSICPLILRDLVVWNETVGSSVTLTVHVVTDNVTLTDQECWLEAAYLGTSGFPLGSVTDDADSITDILLSGSATNQTTSTETWTTTGLATPVKQQLSVSITPQEKGPIRCRVMLAKASTTVYVCPKVECSSVTEGRTYQAGAEMYLTEPSTAGGSNAYVIGG